MPNRKVKIKYIKAYDFKATLATGVYGGISANGLINANFFVDRVVLPQYQNVEIDENGETIGVPIDEKDADIAREVICSILFDLNSAKVITDWLQSKIKEHESKLPTIQK